MQRHTERNAVATAGTRVGSPVLEAYQAHSAIPAGCSPTRQIGDSLAAASSSGTGRSRKGPIWRVRRLRKCNVGWELACCESSVRVRCHGAASCSRATIQVFFAECPQTAKNTAVELDVHGLAFGDKFMVHNPSNVEKHDEYAFDRAAALPRLLRSWGSWTLPIRKLVWSQDHVRRPNSRP